jgi:hypothetical protein
MGLCRFGRRLADNNDSDWNGRGRVNLVTDLDHLTIA